MKKTIAIIGMGLCGNAVFCRLIQFFENASIDTKEINILIFEENQHYFATGFAYAINNPDYWTLNNPADGFKFISGTESLTDWIKSQVPEQSNNPYVPRATVGHYLKAQFSKYKQIAEALGITIEIKNNPVLNVDALDNSLYKIKSNDVTHEAQAVFLTTGHLQTGYFHHLENNPGFIHLDNLSPETNIPNTLDDIYVIGGQAGFVDAALWLTIGNGFEGKIHSVTRTPQILTTKGNPDTCDTTALTALTDELKNRSNGSLNFRGARALFWLAYEKAAQSPVNHEHLPSAQEALLYQMNKFDKKPEHPSSKGNIDELRDFFKSFYLNGCYEWMWKSLNDEGKSQFLNYFYSLFMSFLTGITPVNARCMLALYERGSIIEHQGLTSVYFDEKSQCFILSMASGEQLKAKFLIDASGYRYRPDEHNNNPMLPDRMAQSGLIQSKPLGGLQLTDSFQIIDSKGRIHPSLFCIGPVANFNHPVPTPHSSFMVGPSVEKAIEQLAMTLETNQPTPSCLL